jgi:hypothetical protein
MWHRWPVKRTSALLPSMPEDEAEKLRASLLAYCRLDTLAMVKILEKLRQTQL